MRGEVLLVALIPLLIVAQGAQEPVLSKDVNLPPEPPKNDSTTVAPISTTASTTTSTTTIKPSSPSTTASTTAAPPPTTKSTTTAPSTTTPAPNPPKPVEPSTGLWAVNYTGTNTSCVLLQGAIQITVPYNTTSNKTFTAPVDIPANATAVGACGNATQFITLQWGRVNDTVANNVTLTFVKEKGHKYELASIAVSLTPDDSSFPAYNGTNVIALDHKHPDYPTDKDKSYKCAPKQTLNLTNALNETRAELHVTNLHFQAFFNTTSKSFTNAEDCVPYDTPDIVPIAVGCALAALVVIVVVAYLVGRRRSQARGYLSM